MEPSYPVGGNVNCYSHHREQYRSSLKKKTKKKNYNWSYHMTQQSLSWAYIQRKTWFKRIHAPQCSLRHVHNSQDMKQLKCPLTEEWIKRCGTYTQWNITQVI